MSRLVTESQSKSDLPITSQLATKLTMKDNLNFTNALIFWLGRKGIAQGELAKRMDVTPNTISQYKTGVRTPPMDTLEKLVEALGVTLPEFFACKDDSKPDVVFIEKVKARPRAGTGGLETDSRTDGLYSFHSSFITRKGGSEKTMKLFEVAGESMTPTLNDGDMIMVNTKETEVRSGRIYLLRIGEELMVKRLENRPGGVLLIRSDNKDYEDLPVNLTEVDGDIEIFGRMVWSCREY